MNIVENLLTLESGIVVVLLTAGGTPLSNSSGPTDQVGKTTKIRPLIRSLQCGDSR